MKQLTKLQKTNKQNEVLKDNSLQLDHNSKPMIAIMHCYDLIYDFLETINVSFETYCNELAGGWMVGYINALQKVGVRAAMICISARVDAPSRFVHKPTGASIYVLHPPKIYYFYRVLRRKLLNTYAGSEVQYFEKIQDSNSLRRSILRLFKDSLKSLGTYLSTPLGKLTRELCRAILLQEYEYARFDVCALWGKVVNLPVYATFQGGNRTQSILEFPLKQLAFRPCKGVIVSSQNEIQRIHQRCYNIPLTKIARIIDPLDTEFWYATDRNEARSAIGNSNRARVVVCHGRIEIKKEDLDILLEVWNQICLKRCDQDLRLFLVGTGSDAEELHQRIENMQLRGVMWENKFIGDRSLIRSYLSAADIYILSSRQEGFPIAPLEAMACGLPVVATDVPGIPDILENGEASGGLIVPRNDAKALAEALGQLLDDAARSRELGRRARRRIEQSFSPESIGSQLRNFLLQE